MSKLCLCGPARQEELQTQSSLTKSHGDLHGLGVPGGMRTHWLLQPPWRQEAAPIGLDPPALSLASGESSGDSTRSLGVH